MVSTTQISYLYLCLNEGITYLGKLFFLQDQKSRQNVKYLEYEKGF